MSKGKLYKISKTKNTINKEDEIKVFIVSLIVYAIVLMIANSLFKGIYVENFFYAIIASIILSLLKCVNYNMSIKLSKQK